MNVPRDPILITQKLRQKNFARTTRLYPAAFGITPYCNRTTSNLMATALIYKWVDLDFIS